MMKLAHTLSFFRDLCLEPTIQIFPPDALLCCVQFSGDDKGSNATLTGSPARVVAETRACLYSKLRLLPQERESDL